MGARTVFQSEAGKKLESLVHHPWEHRDFAEIRLGNAAKRHTLQRREQKKAKIVDKFRKVAQSHIESKKARGSAPRFAAGLLGAAQSRRPNTEASDVLRSENISGFLESSAVVHQSKNAARFLDSSAVRGPEKAARLPESSAVVRRSENAARFLLPTPLLLTVATFLGTCVLSDNARAPASGFTLA